MIATGSIDGGPDCTSRVATSFTQSVEPGSGTSSTLMPAAAYQTILVATAKGAAAELTVPAHQAMRTVVCADASLARLPTGAAASATATSARIMTGLPSWPAPRRRVFATGPRTARA